MKYKNKILIFTKIPVKTLIEVEKIMEPYKSNALNTCKKDYLVFINIEDRCRTAYKKIVSGEFYKFREYTFDETVPTFDNFAQNYLKLQKNPASNKWGLWENPNQKWINWQPERLILSKYGDMLCCELLKDIIEIKQSHDSINFNWSIITENGEWLSVSDNPLHNIQDFDKNLYVITVGYE